RRTLPEGARGPLAALREGRVGALAVRGARHRRRTLEARCELLAAEPAEHERLRGEIGGGLGLWAGGEGEGDGEAADERSGGRRAIVARRVGAPQARGVIRRAGDARVGARLAGLGPGRASAAGTGDETVGRTGQVDVGEQRDVERRAPAAAGACTGG